jgi:uncharacterized Fe-S cluster-containing radical SAM superfamily enzyme
VYNCEKQAGNVRVKIISTKHNIYTAMPI